MSKTEHTLNLRADGQTYSVPLMDNKVTEHALCIHKGGATLYAPLSEKKFDEHSIKVNKGGVDYYTSSRPRVRLTGKYMVITSNGTQVISLQDVKLSSPMNVDVYIKPVSQASGYYYTYMQPQYAHDCYIKQGTVNETSGTFASGSMTIGADASGIPLCFIGVALGNSDFYALYRCKFNPPYYEFDIELGSVDVTITNDSNNTPRKISSVATVTDQNQIYTDSDIKLLPISGSTSSMTPTGSYLNVIDKDSQSKTTTTYCTGADVMSMAVKDPKSTDNNTPLTLPGYASPALCFTPYGKGSTNKFAIPLGRNFYFE